MPSRLADRLSAARHRRFVGRTSEREVFQSALAATEFPFQVLYIFGPGGVGKSTLLREFVSLTEQAGLTAIYLDARNVEPSPESFFNALRLAAGNPPAKTPPHP